MALELLTKETKMRKLLARLLTLAVLVTGGTLVAAQPAAAALSDCPPGIGCLWQDGYGEGAMLGMTLSGFFNGNVNSCRNLASPWNSTTSSVRNRYGTELDLMIYTSTNCVTSSGRKVENGTWLNLTTGGWNDLIRSVKLIYG